MDSQVFYYVMVPVNLPQQQKKGQNIFFNQLQFYLQVCTGMWSLSLKDPTNGFVSVCQPPLNIINMNILDVLIKPTRKLLYLLIILKF